MDLSANSNTYWMSIFVEELARNGLEAVCLAPGSRSTPLTLAFATQAGVRIYRHLDERSAGFFALGLAKATKRPVALVCTSGTAAANFHPAIIEAYYAHVPLLVLTADRPPELRGSGANQTIDQIKMFGDHVRWAVEAPTPQHEAPALALRHLRTLAARAYATADGLIKGPVHLNFPFRKPLEPEIAPSASMSPARLSPDAAQPFTRISRARLLPTAEQIAETAGAIRTHRRGLIICGPECPGGSFPTDLVALAEQAGYPILADPLSNLRHAPEASQGLVLGGYNLWLPAMAERLGDVEIVLRFGVVPTSSALASFLERAAPQHHYHVREDGQWADDLHLTHRLIQAEPAVFCRDLAATLDKHSSARREWADVCRAAERQAWAQLDCELKLQPFFDGAAIAQVLAALPDDTDLFVGNSLPVRHVDMFDRPGSRRVTLYGNRGASGIDGNVSTALGLAAAGGRRVVALLGDITFYHDMNGLLAVGQHQLNNVIFVVVNNDGGGIFHRLPVARHDPPFTDLFLTPHGLTFAPAAQLYGLAYRAVADADDLKNALSDCLVNTAGPSVIEVRTNSQEDYRQVQSISVTVQASVRRQNSGII